MEMSFDGRTTEVKREESVLRVLVFGERGAFVECGNRFVADVCVGVCVCVLRRDQLVLANSVAHSFSH